MTDIVERLRKAAERPNGWAILGAYAAIEAADEIERLRARLAELQTCPNCGLQYTGCGGEDVHARLAELNTQVTCALQDIHSLRVQREALCDERDALAARLAEAERGRDALRLLLWDMASDPAIVHWSRRIDAALERKP